MAITGASDGYMVLVPPAQGQSATVSALINRDANGALAVPTEQWIQSPATGLYVPVNYGQPMPTGGGRATSELTTTALGASATYTGAWVDMQAAGWSYLSASVVADQAGTLYVDAADNQSYPILGVASYAFAPATAGTAKAAELPYPVYAKCRYMRLRYVNGTTAQGTCQLYQTTLHASPRDVELTDSSATIGQVNIQDSSGAGIHSFSDSDAAGTAATLGVLARAEGFTGATWDRIYNNTQGILLASAARTASFNGPMMTAFNARGILLAISVTAVSGASPQLIVAISSPDPSSSSYVNLLTLPAITATGEYAGVVYPGASGTNANILASAAFPLARSVVTGYGISGSSASFTFSVGYFMIV